MVAIDATLWKVHGSVPCWSDVVLRGIERRQRAREAWVRDWAPPPDVGVRERVDAMTDTYVEEYAATASLRARSYAERLSGYAARTAQLARRFEVHDEKHAARASTEMSAFVAIARAAVWDWDNFVHAVPETRSRFSGYAHLEAVAWRYVDRVMSRAARSTAHLWMLDRVRRSREDWQTWVEHCWEETAAGWGDEDQPFAANAAGPETEGRLPSEPELHASGHETRAGPRESQSKSDPDCVARSVRAPRGEANYAPHLAKIGPPSAPREEHA